MKLYVGNLPYNTTDADLNELFSQVGQVESASVLMDKMTGRSRGFGFVEMPSDDEAKRAIEMFNNKDFGGRNMVVNEARPLTEGAPRRSFGGGDRGDRRGGFGGGRRDNNRY